jgi:hypothetical protein
MINHFRPLPLSDDPAVRRCAEVMQKIHANDKRIISGLPYWFHPWSVAQIQQRLRFGVVRICAALLHDTVEERHILSFEELYDKILCKDVPERLAREIVAGVMTVTIDPSWPKNEIYDRYCEALEENPRAIPVAIADRYDNVRDDLEHLRLGVDVFGPRNLNCDPRQAIIDWLQVTAVCNDAALPQDKARVAMLCHSIADMTVEIRRLLRKGKRR